MRNLEREDHRQWGEATERAARLRGRADGTGGQGRPAELSLQGGGVLRVQQTNQPQVLAQDHAAGKVLAWEGALVCVPAQQNSAPHCLTKCGTEPFLPEASGAS